MGRKCIVLILFLLLAQWGEAQDNLAVAEQFRQSGEELSEPMNLSGGADTYTLYFYMKDGVPVGAIAFDKSGEPVLDPVLYKRLVCAAYFLRQDLEKFYTFLEGSEKTVEEMNTLIGSLEQEEYSGIRGLMNLIALLPDYPERLSEIIEELDNIYDGIDDYVMGMQDNWIVRNKEKLTTMKEGNITGYEFYSQNQGKVKEEFHGIETNFSQFVNQLIKEKKLRNEFYNLVIDYLMTKGYKPSEKMENYLEEFEDEEKKARSEAYSEKGKWNSTLAGAKEILGLAILSDEEAETFAEDLYGVRMKPRLDITINGAEEVESGDTVSFEVLLKNSGFTKAHVSLEATVDTLTKDDSLDLDIGEEKKWEINFPSSGLEPGRKTLLLATSYSGIRGTFEQKEQKDFLIKRNFTIHILIGGAFILAVGLFFFLKRRKGGHTDEKS